ncbi:MAG: SDR family oxidoreductase [Bacteroidota bacterium]
MQISLKGKRALVGGASRGLGRAIALQLAASGAQVTLLARNEESLQGVLRQLSTAEGQTHQYLVVDFADLGKFTQAMSAFFEQHVVDILVNNTNGPAAGTVLEKGLADYQQSFDLLFKTVNVMTMQALPGMRKRNFGRIINLSSISVKEPLQNLVLSNSIRSAVISWAKTLARDVAADGITVNNILTGYFDTERLNEIHGAQAKAKGISIETQKANMQLDIPAKRLGQPEEFAYLVAFLASANAAYITGTNIPIDGGLLRSV